MNIFGILNNQLLKMEWLARLVESLVENVFGLDVSTHVGGSLHFFIYDIIKIFILLSVLIFVISYIQSYFPPERTKKMLGRLDGISANILGALLGTLTPFCSCSSIPIFTGFTNAGLPLGLLFHFNFFPIGRPGIYNTTSSIFNWKIAIAYVIVGLILAIIGGTVIGKSNLEGYVAPFVYSNDMAEVEQVT